MQDHRKPRTADYGSSDHEHKFYLFKTTTAFEPVLDLHNTPQQYYVLVEYAIMFCNCGETIKTRVKNRDE